MLFGAHVSSSGGIWQAIDRAEAIGWTRCRCSPSPRMWRPTNHTPEGVDRFRERRAEAGIRASSVMRSTSSTSPRDPVIYESLSQRCGQPWKPPCDRRRRGDLPRRLASRGGIRGGPRAVVPALKELLELTTDDLWLLMENSAGAGGTIGRSIDELAAIHEALDHHPRLGTCLDSCHWYVSGVDVTDRAVLEVSRSRRSTAGSGSTGFAAFTSTTPRRHSAPTSTGTRRRDPD